MLNRLTSLRLGLWVGVSLWFFTGCAQRLSLDDELPATVSALAFQHFDNPDFHCGPATLASILDFYQRPADFEHLSSQLILPGKGGTLQLDMDRVARQQGLVPYPVGDDFNELLLWLDRGHPVLLFENLGLSWAPKWHYSLLRGYDLERRMAVLSSGKHPYLEVSFHTLNNTWQRGGAWARVLLPPETAAANISVREQLRQGQNLLATGLHDSAYALFKRLAADDQPLAQIALGNLYYQQQRWPDSQQAYQQALQQLPFNASLWFNYSLSLASECPTAAQQALMCSQQLGLSTELPTASADNDPASCPVIQCSATNWQPLLSTP